VSSIGAGYLLLNATWTTPDVSPPGVRRVSRRGARAIPTGDQQGKMVAHHQPVTLAAMEGSQTVEGAPLVIVGQPDMER